MRPTTITTIPELHEFYWLKSDLIQFCRQHHLAVQGTKEALINRIETFLVTGQKERHSKISKTKARDSDHPITRKTHVVHYYNDAKTREFFVSQIGKQFKFNAYLRQFTNSDNIKPRMTYGDLVEGWILAEADRSNKPIPHQFEYNQFIQDYFTHEKSATLKEAIAAWKFIKARPGPNTYSQFRLFQP